MKPQGNRIAPEVIAGTVGVLLFAWCISASFPVRLLAVAGLLFSGYFMLKQIFSLSDFFRTTGLYLERRYLLYLVAGLLSGVLIALIYRRYLGMDLLPGRMTAFVGVAALIGASEELYFRGYLQGRLSQVHPLLALAGGTTSHTLYKIFLFLTPFAQQSADIVFLAMYTFFVGIGFGWLRQLTKSIWPALLAHALFDVMVYGELAVAPWWVW